MTYRILGKRSFCLFDKGLMTLKRDLKIILIKNLLSYFKRITVSFHALPGKSEEVDSFLSMKKV